MKTRKKRVKKIRGGSTYEEMEEALNDYSSFDYVVVNCYLRGEISELNEEERNKAIELIEHLDAAFLDKDILGEDSDDEEDDDKDDTDKKDTFTLYRGVHKTNKKETNEEWIRKVAVGIQPAYTSTSYSGSFVNSAYTLDKTGIMMELTVSSEIPVIKMEFYSQYPREFEILLPRGLRFTITKFLHKGHKENPFINDLVCIDVTKDKKDENMDEQPAKKRKTSH